MTKFLMPALHQMSQWMVLQSEFTTMPENYNDGATMCWIQV